MLRCWYLIGQLANKVMIHSKIEMNHSISHSRHFPPRNLRKVMDAFHSIENVFEVQSIISLHRGHFLHCRISNLAPHCPFGCHIYFVAELFFENKASPTRLRRSAPFSKSTRISISLVSVTSSFHNRAEATYLLDLICVVKLLLVLR